MGGICVACEWELKRVIAEVILASASCFTQIDVERTKGLVLYFSICQRGVCVLWLDMRTNIRIAGLLATFDSCGINTTKSRKQLLRRV